MNADIKIEEGMITLGTKTLTLIVEQLGQLEGIVTLEDAVGYIVENDTNFQIATSSTEEDSDVIDAEVLEGVE